MTKQELRQRLIRRRAEIAPEEKKKMDADIVARIAATSAFQNASAILLYAPLEGEINLLPLARLARQRSIPIAFPRCDTEKTELRFYLLEPDARLSPGAYRIPEPPSDAPLCQLDERTLCILPGLGFDLSGARLGYGKGYYDRFLADFPGITVGAVYQRMLLKSTPVEPHDLPVSFLVTEQAIFSCRKAGTDTVERQTKGEKESPSAPEAQTAVCAVSEGEKDLGKAPEDKTVGFWGRMLTSVRAYFSQDKLVGKNGEVGSLPTPRHAPPILVCAAFALLLLSRLLDTWLTDRNNAFALVILLQVLIFLIPALIYVRLRGSSFLGRIRMRAPQFKHLWFLVCMLPVMISGSMLCGILTGGIASLSGNFTLYDTFVARTDGGIGAMIYVILAYCVLPAFCEELIFRGILCAEYESFGVAVSVGVSALFFAMLHFTFPLFLTYFLLGLLLALSMYVTRSFFAAFALHLLYNLFCLFGQPYLSAFYIYAGNNEIFIFCLVVLFLLFGAFAAGEARKIYHRYARQNLDSTYTQPVPVRALGRALVRALFSPTVAPCVLIWLVMSILNLF